MIKTLKNLLKQDKERYTVPRKVQDVIPVRRIWKDGIFQVGSRFSKTYKFTDINYLVASREDKESMFLAYSELLNSLDSGATTKITINNRRLNRANFEQSILMPMRGDACDVYRREYNQMLLDKATGVNGIIQEKYITVSVCKKDIEEARTYFARIGADLIAHFATLGSKCTELDAAEKLRVLHDFYRQGEEAAFHFDPQDMMRKGHDFKDYICPNSMEKSSDCLKLGEKYCRVLFLKDYASYIKDSMVTELTDFNRNMMLSIDVVPIPTDEAVREVENRLLGIETNITNWQRRQNANNNFSAVVPYDMELQRKESKEFLDDLTTRDQRMMLAVITMVITADDKKQLDSDTETVLAVARKHMCQLAVLKFQQFDGLNTVLPIGGVYIKARKKMADGESAFACAIPWQVPVLCHVRPFEYYDGLRDTLTKEEFMRECESKCTGSVDNPLLRDQYVQDAKTLTIMEDRHCGDPNVRYYIGYDVSYRQRNGNAMCAEVVLKTYEQRRSTSFKKDCVYLTDLPPLDAERQARRIKNRWAQYRLEGAPEPIIVIDSWQFGEAVVQQLHRDLGDGLPPLCTVNNDDRYLDLVQKNAKPCIYSLYATPGRSGADPNIDMLDYLTREFEHGNVGLLITNVHEGTRAYKMAHNIKDDTQDVKIQHPYIKTKELCDQIANLRRKKTGSGWTQEEINKHINKDLWSAMMYAARPIKLDEDAFVASQNRRKSSYQEAAEHLDSEITYAPVRTRSVRRLGRGAIV